MPDTTPSFDDGPLAPLCPDDAVEIERELADADAVEVRALAWSLLATDAARLATLAARPASAVVVDAIADQAERLRHVARLLDVAARRVSAARAALALRQDDPDRPGRR